MLYYTDQKLRQQGQKKIARACSLHTELIQTVPAGATNHAQADIKLGFSSISNYQTLKKKLLLETLPSVTQMSTSYENHSQSEQANI